MLKDMGRMLKQLQEAQSKMAKAQEELAARTVEGSAGGGMVTVVVNGRGEFVSIKIDPSVVDADDVEMLEDLVAAAVTDAQSRAQELMRDEMTKLTGGLSIPGLM
jgi:DNA-binding YbaB/EbfC family protein